VVFGHERHSSAHLESGVDLEFTENRVREQHGEGISNPWYKAISQHDIQGASEGGITEDFY